MKIDLNSMRDIAQGDIVYCREVLNEIDTNIEQGDFLGALNMFDTWFEDGVNELRDSLTALAGTGE